jgi:DNA-directed RNA polymerase
MRAATRRGNPERWWDWPDQPLDGLLCCVRNNDVSSMQNHQSLDSKTAPLCDWQSEAVHYSLRTGDLMVTGFT